jgi:hypothetical protein
MHVVGVDGWIAIEYDLSDQAINPRIFTSFAELI